MVKADCDSAVGHQKNLQRQTTMQTDFEKLQRGIHLIGRGCHNNKENTVYSEVVDSIIDRKHVLLHNNKKNIIVLLHNSLHNYTAPPATEAESSSKQQEKPNQLARQSYFHHQFLDHRTKMNSNGRISKMNMILVVFQLLGITMPVFCESSGRFAVVQRRNGYIEGAPKSPLSPFRRRRSIHSYNYDRFHDDTEKSEYGYEHDTVFQADDRHFQDSAPECTGRFAVEYEVERRMMRSAGNAHIQHQAIYNEHDDAIIKNAYRSKPAAMFHSKRIKHESKQRRSAFSYEMEDSIFV